MIGKIKESDLCKDIDGNPIKVGARILCIETWDNHMLKGTVTHYTSSSVMIKLDKRAWARQVRHWNTERMIYVLPEEKKK